MKYPNFFPFKIWQVVQVFKKKNLYMGWKMVVVSCNIADHPQEKLAMAIVQGGK
jgi:hypothetical protein